LILLLFYTTKYNTPTQYLRNGTVVALYQIFNGNGVCHIVQSIHDFLPKASCRTISYLSQLLFDRLVFSAMQGTGASGPSSTVRISPTVICDGSRARTYPPGLPLCFPQSLHALKLKKSAIYTPRTFRIFRLCF